MSKRKIIKETNTFIFLDCKSCDGTGTKKIYGSASRMSVQPCFICNGFGIVKTRKKLIKELTPKERTQ